MIRSEYFNKSPNCEPHHQGKLKKLKILSVVPAITKEHTPLVRKSSKILLTKERYCHSLERKSTRTRLRGGGILQQTCFPMTCTPMICLPSSPQMICNPYEPTVLVCTPCPKEATGSTPCPSATTSPCPTGPLSPCPHGATSPYPGGATSPCPSGAISVAATPQLGSPSQYQQSPPCIQVQPPTPQQQLSQLPSLPSTGFAGLPPTLQNVPPYAPPLDFSARPGYLQPCAPAPSLPMDFRQQCPTPIETLQNVQCGGNLDQRWQSQIVGSGASQRLKINTISLPAIKIEEIFHSLKGKTKESDAASFAIQISYVDSGDGSSKICPGERPKPRPETRKDLFGARRAMVAAPSKSRTRDLTLTDHLNDSFIDKKILEAVEKYTVKELTKEELDALPYATRVIYQLAKVYIDERYMLIQMLLQAKQIKAKITNPSFKEGQNPGLIRMYLKLKADSLDLAQDLKTVYDLFIVVVSRWIEQNPDQRESVTKALGHFPPQVQLSDFMNFSQSSCATAPQNTPVQCPVSNLINFSQSPCIPTAPPNTPLQGMMNFSQSPCMPTVPSNTPVQQGQISAGAVGSGIQQLSAGQQSLGGSFGPPFNVPVGVAQTSFYQPAGQEKLPMSLNVSSIGAPNLQSTGIADLKDTEFHSMDIQLSISETDPEGNVTNIEHDFNLPKDVKASESKTAGGFSEEDQQKEKDMMIQLLKEYQDSRRQAVMSNLTSQDVNP